LGLPGVARCVRIAAAAAAAAGSCAVRCHTQHPVSLHHRRMLSCACFWLPRAAEKRLLTQANAITNWDEYYKCGWQCGAAGKEPQLLSLAACPARAACWPAAAACGLRLCCSRITTLYLQSTTCRDGWTTTPCQSACGRASHAPTRESSNSCECRRSADPVAVQQERRRAAAAPCVCVACCR